RAAARRSPACSPTAPAPASSPRLAKSSTSPPPSAPREPREVAMCHVAHSHRPSPQTGTLRYTAVRSEISWYGGARPAMPHINRGPPMQDNYDLAPQAPPQLPRRPAHQAPAPGHAPTLNYANPRRPAAPRGVVHSAHPAVAAVASANPLSVRAHGNLLLVRRGTPLPSAASSATTSP